MFHHHFPGIWFLHEFTQIFWDDLPSETELVIAPTTLYFLTFSRKIPPISINLILVLTVDNQGKCIIERMMWLCSCHHRIWLPKNTHLSHLCITAWSLSERHNRVYDKSSLENRLIIIEYCSDGSVRSVEPESRGERSGGHRWDSYGMK